MTGNGSALGSSFLKSIGTGLLILFISILGVQLLAPGALFFEEDLRSLEIERAAGVLFYSVVFLTLLFVYGYLLYDGSGEMRRALVCAIIPSFFVLLGFCGLYLLIKKPDRLNDAGVGTLLLNTFRLPSLVALEIGIPPLWFVYLLFLSAFYLLLLRVAFRGPHPQFFNI